jgi:hypothetical protein
VLVARWWGGVSFHSFFSIFFFRCREFYSINVTGCSRDLMTHFPTLATTKKVGDSGK